MRFGFLVTSRCNAACLHCSTSCGPHETAELPTTTIVALMDQAAAIWRRERVAREPLVFAITGGEPFLDFARLRAIVAHGAALGGIVTCVTNAYWAANDGKARALLTTLREAGLTRLAVSTSRFHQRFVKLERASRAVRVARALGIGTSVKIAYTVTDRRDPEGVRRWSRSCGAEKAEVFPLMPYLRDGARLADGVYVRRTGLPRGRCPAAGLTIAADQKAYTCCMPGAFTEFLALGDVTAARLDELYQRFYLGPRQRVLRQRGPIYFARAVLADGHGHRLRGAYESPCDLCAHIARDPVMSRIASESADTFARDQLRAILRRRRAAFVPSAGSPALPGD